jgi:hypothetical protein
MPHNAKAHLRAPFTDRGVEVRGWPPPERAEEAVRAVVRHRHRHDLDPDGGAERRRQRIHGGELAAVEHQELGQIRPDEPEPRGRWVPREEDDPLAGDACASG